MWKKRIGARLMLGISAILVVVVSALAGVAVRMLNAAVQRAEHAQLEALFHSAQASIADEARLSSALSTLVAHLPAAQEAFAGGKRDELRDMFGPAFTVLKEEYGTEQFQFHTPPATSFLRVHSPKKFGDDLSSFRQTVVDVNRDHKPVSGVEAGVAGLGIRGVVPVAHAGQQIGSVEFGMDLGPHFFDRFKQTYGADAAFYQRKGDGFDTRGSTMSEEGAPDSTQLRSALAQADVPVVVRRRAGSDKAVLLGQIGDYTGKPVGVLEIAIEHAPYAELITRTRVLILLIGVLALVLGVGVAFLLTRAITAPLAAAGELVSNLARGRLSARINSTRQDEIGKLTRDLDGFAEHLQANVLGAVDRLSRGDLDVDVAARDAQDEVAPAVRRLRDSLGSVVQDTARLIGAARAGDLRARGETARYDGAYRDLIAAVNELLDTVTAPIHESAAVFERVAHHDLTARMQGTYSGEFAELQRSVNAALAKLDHALSEVAATSDEVASASGQISEGSQALAEGASEQASSLEEVSSSLQELSSMSRQNSNSAREARVLASAARDSAAAGAARMGQLSEAMEKIKGSADATAKIVKTIDEIAFQTNLLALNAAVEAARAGDAGKGFAVVAEEVRSLAQRSAEAARNTADLIEQGVGNAEGGVALNREVAAQLQEILSRVEKVGDVMQEIEAASDQQNKGVGEISTAVEQMNGVTQQVAANSEEGASAAEELSSQAERLKELVAEFKLGERRSRPAAVEAAVPMVAAVAAPERTLTGNGKANGSGHSRIAAELIPFGDADEALAQF